MLDSSKVLASILGIEGKSFDQIMSVFYTLNVRSGVAVFFTEFTEDNLHDSEQCYALYRDNLSSVFLSKCEMVVRRGKNSDEDDLIYKLVGKPREVYRSGNLGHYTPDYLKGKQLLGSTLVQMYLHKENCNIFSKGRNKKCSCQTIKYGYLEESC
jgi:hypothetical protein